MKNAFIGIMLSVSLCAVVAMPVLVDAQVLNSVIPCGRGDANQISQPQTDSSNPDVNKACDFNTFVKLIQNVINALTILSVPVAAIAFAYTGWLILFAQGDMGKVRRAKEIATNVMWGFVFILFAWALIRFITAILLNPKFNIFLG